ncbi:sugar ABC transporter substrate-binding protein [Treponema sp. OMZ 840]|uniref:ABC transporter substrate-binding protein n=1 Tax=Treponema sp. OMZ 840 TaxID=244313 RepID=UPI003D906D1B
MKKKMVALLTVSMLLFTVGCSVNKKTEKVQTITVWDYYGKEVSPLAVLVEKFEKENSDIKVLRQDLDWETMHTKLNVILSSNNVPDVVTADLTWMPVYGSLGVFTDLKKLSGNLINGENLENIWAPSNLEAMTYDGKLIGALYDFDAYCLYYRNDLFSAKGLKVPQTWEELVTAGKAIAKDDKYKYAALSDVFHAVQFVYENGGEILNKDNTAAAFTSEQAKEAFQFYGDLVNKHKMAIHWTDGHGDLLQGIKDERIAMFSDGPYRMAQMKEIAPEQSGKWSVAPHPFSKKPGTYLGGTALVIPERSKNKEVAWKFIEFLLKPENAALVYTQASAGPAVLTVFDHPEFSVPDPYFNNEKPLQLFKDALIHASAFPKIREWDSVDFEISEATVQILGGYMSVEDALNTAAEKVNAVLQKK